MASARQLREARQPAQGHRLRIDPAACDGVGICAHLAPDLVTVDAWGYPILRDAELSGRRERRQAEAAVAACPRRALHLS